MKVGLIGCGGIASFPIEVYIRIKHVEAITVCDLNLTPNIETEVLLNGFHAD